MFCPLTFILYFLSPYSNSQTEVGLHQMFGRRPNSKNSLGHFTHRSPKFYRGSKISNLALIYEIFASLKYGFKTEEVIGNLIPWATMVIDLRSDLDTPLTPCLNFSRSQYVRCSAVTWRKWKHVLCVTWHCDRNVAIWERCCNVDCVTADQRFLQHNIRITAVAMTIFSSRRWRWHGLWRVTTALFIPSGMIGAFPRQLSRSPGMLVD